MKYGQIAGNKSINAMIYRCFEHIPEEDARKFVKKFSDQLSDEVQVMHTFRELILGAYLVCNDLNVRYEYALGTKTPDWCVMDGSSSFKAIVELTNFHLDKTTEDNIKERVQPGGMWMGWQKPNDDRLYNQIWQKAASYKTLVEQYDISYIIAVFGEFTAAVNSDELDQCLFDKEYGLFGLYPIISGVLFFDEQFGRYSFTYKPNPNSSKAIHIPSGEF